MAAEHGRRGQVTLNDVAARAGVSRALVSIVMRDVPGASAQTRERVRAAAIELGYRPDARARSLAGQRSRMIGVMFGVSLGGFQFDLLEGLYAAAEDHGLNLVLSPLTRGRDEAKAAQSLNDFRFDAVIMLGPQTVEPLLAGQVPVVVVGWHVDHPAVDVVRTSDVHGMAAAVGHLADLGHRRIAHIDGGPGLVSGSHRDGYTQAMQDRGLGSEVHVMPGGDSQLAGQRAARLLLDGGNLPTAVITYNDDTAAAAMSLLIQEGVPVPGGVSIIGWDDGEAANLAPVALTTVAQDPRTMARLAMERVVSRVAGRPVEGREIVLEPDLHIRASTAGTSKDTMS
jgi:DNA-binding LacI/PurR family transcriptional regulator